VCTIVCGPSPEYSTFPGFDPPLLNTADIGKNGKIEKDEGTTLLSTWFKQ
jgi:hypothetical protein